MNGGDGDDDDDDDGDDYGDDGDDDKDNVQEKKNLCYSSLCVRMLYLWYAKPDQAIHSKLNHSVVVCTNLFHKLFIMKLLHYENFVIEKCVCIYFQSTWQNWSERKLE